MTPISPANFQKILADSAKKTLVLDVRSPDEFRAAAVPGAANAPLETVASHAEIFAHFDRAVLVCRSGARAEKAAQKLRAAGVAGEVFVLEGGVAAWEKFGGEIVRGRAGLPVIRQVQMIAGAFAFLGGAAAIFGEIWGGGLAALVGAGLFFAGATGWCGMAIFLGKMPWNRD